MVWDLSAFGVSFFQKHRRIEEGSSLGPELLPQIKPDPRIMTSSPSELELESGIEGHGYTNQCYSQESNHFLIRTEYFL